MSTKKTAPTGANRPDTAMEGMMAGKYVLVTTEHRGVFVGELAEDNTAERIAVLDDARNVIYWSGSRGFIGLAVTGPENGSRLGDTAPRIRLHGVTSVVETTDAAEAALRGWPLG